MKKQEFIGKQAKISYNGQLFTGIIVDETKNMIHLQTEDGVKKIIKKNATFTINNKTIQGKTITRRPQDRIKK